jgi:predicted alpha/beta hydrolase family esterase
MKCPNEQYISIAAALQSAGKEAAQSIWVGLPEFIFDAPEPVLIDNYVEKTIDQLIKAGFTGDNILLAAHSLGGVMAQKYAKENNDQIKGLMLMGSVLARDDHSLNADGTTHFDFPVPTLTMGGTKDGLMRITRMAEAYYHQVENIETT